ncbi:Chromosome transmission fidelity protein 18 [Liparis tanakae]|uniref:Chromosome transmission fidelity protein 18 n=1 Tax=Liparis tanakae TaxID=230148 RepID=A0A4Z2J7X2_9TELE|nr:Chromosome transmission fidelity protein 18 [Liparis tanakae]
MDEYDEMFEVQDEFEDQFADELDALAQLEGEESSNLGRRQNRGPESNTADAERLLQAPPTTPKAKRRKEEAGVAKRLFSSLQTRESRAPSQSDDITPPSSPEQYESPRSRRSIPEVLDISGFVAIPESPWRPPPAAPASLRVLKRPPLDGEYISVTDSSGSRVYLRQTEDTGRKVRLLPHVERCAAGFFPASVPPQCRHIVH